MDVFHNIWSLVWRKGQHNRLGEWFNVPRIYHSKEEEKTDIAKRQLALILDSPDRKRTH